MMRIALVAAVVCAIGAPARAEPGPRVLLADADPELRRAVVSTLAPWKLEVVVDGAAPLDALQARDLADTQTVRFVVWRQGSDLVVFDRERDEAEHRQAPAGALDPVSAAAAALTVKTLMRLPPPPEAEIAPPIDTIQPVPATAPGGPEVRIQAGFATRISRGTQTDLSARAVASALVRPFRLGWRIGIAGELGTAPTIEKAGFKGTWSDWVVLGVTSWTIEVARWEVEPFAGAGISRSRIEGIEMGAPRGASATLPVIRAGLAARWRFDRWSLGAAGAVDVVPSTPTYTRNNGQPIFEPPGLSFAITAFAAADLNR